MNFGANLRRAREARGITQQILAAKVGISQSVVAQYELGTKSPSVVTAEAIARALGIQIEVLLKGDKSNGVD